MIQIFQKKNGAVSVFLSIVLVPMMIVASIMIDYGRVKLGGAMAASAGDLALNTALTDYDNVLKDVYGLMATSQSNDELLEKLEDYYTSSIVAQGVSKADADDYVGQIMDYIKNSSDSSSIDFMNMGNIEFNVEEPKTASLVNPALLRGQIVNFMKYRAPINGGMALLESLKSFSHLSKQMEIVENKQKYYEEQSTLMEDCEKAWGYMAKYVALFGEKEDFQEIQTGMDDAISAYNNINSYMIHNYYNNMSTKYFAYPVTAYQENGKWVMYYDDGVKINARSGSGTPSESELERAINDVEKVVPYLKSNFNNTALDFPKTDILAKYGGGDKYPIQVATQANINKEADFKCFKELYIACMKFEDIYNAVSDSDKDNSVVEIIEKTTGNSKTYEYKVTLASNVSSSNGNTQQTTDNDENTNSNTNENRKRIKLSDYYNSINSLFETQMKNLQDATYSIFGNFAKYNNDYDAGWEYCEKLSDIAEQVTAYKTKLEKAKGYLNDCSTQLSKIADKVNPNGNSKLQQTLNTWNNSASDSSVANDAIAQQDKAEIQQMKQFIKYEDVNKLLTRVNNAITELNNDLDAIKNYKYCKTFIGDIGNLSEFRDVLKGSESAALSNLSMVKDELDTLSKAIAGRQIQSGEIKTDWSGETDKNPVFSEEQYRFYTYLYNNYHKITDSQDESAEVNSNETSKGKKDAEDTKNKIKGLGDSSKDDAKKGNEVTSNSVEDYYTDKTAPSQSELYKNIKSGAYEVPNIGDDSVENGNTSTSLSTLFSKLSDALKNAAVNVRDYIFIEEYIMNMFSYNTYEAEIKDKIKDKSGVTYESKAKTFTNVPINANNNYAYKQEVEYVIYGNNGTTKAYATIFGIRLAMNCIYAFTNSDLREGAYGIAVSIFGVPPLTGLVPIAKNAILFAVAIAESGLDLGQLKQGKAVALIKDKNTWCLSFNNLVNVLKEQAASLTQYEINKISDNVKGKVNEWLDYGEDELKDKVNSGATEFTDLVDQMTDNVNNEVDRYVGVVTNELTTLCTKANDLLQYGKDDQGEEITEANQDSVRLEYIKSNLELWWNSEKNNMDASTLAYKIEEAAVSYLLNSASSEITEIFNMANKKTEDLGNALTTKISDLSSDITASVKKSCEEINKYISNIRANLQESANKGIDTFRDQLNNGVSNLFGTGKDSSNSLDIEDSNTSSVASKFKFRYSDYLRVFLMIALIGNSDNVMAKTSDILQANMSKITGKEFKLEQSYTYIKISAEVDVKPLLLTLPWMNDTTQKYMGGKNYYRVSYTGISGY
jgi:hypothetical protein